MTTSRFAVVASTLTGMLTVGMIGLWSSMPALDHVDSPPLPRMRSVRVALLQHGYWSGGFDRPLFLMLRDGTVIYPRTFDDRIPRTYARLSLSQAGADSLLATLGVNSSLAALDPVYDYAPGVTDQHSFYLLLPDSNATRVLVFRAAWEHRTRLRAAVPGPFRRLHRNLMALAARAADPWVPDSVQFDIWPYEYAPDNPPLRLPVDLPGLDNPRWQRRPDAFVDEVWTLKLPFAAVPRLDSLLKAVRPRQALGISGRKWAFDYRWIFPGEHEWRQVAGRLEY